MNPERWLDEHGDFLYRYACARLRDKVMAEDVVQETFLAAFKAQDRFQPGLSERAWLVGILRHKIVDHIRKSSREITLDHSDFAEIENSALFKYAGIPTTHPPAWKFSPRKAMENKEFWDTFSHCLTRLKSLMHSTFVLKELEGWSTEEICKELGITANHVWVLIHRARSQLKACLEAHWHQRPIEG